MTAPPFPVPVFAAVGAGAWGPTQELRGRPELRLVASPRHASVLLVAGAVAGEHAEALDRVHDQLPHPRCTVAWTGAPARHPVAATVVTGPADQLVAAVVDAHRQVTADRSRSEPDRLPDTEPNEWRGVGPHGQGGEGMMGGTPYGRPMAMTGDDRDGLALDQLQLRLGPFLDALPPGLVLDVTLQGEVLQAVALSVAAFGEDPIGAPLAGGPGLDPAAALRRGLAWLAHGLHVHGLDPLAARAARLAPRTGDAPAREVRALRRAVRRSGLLWALRGVGRLADGTDAADRWAARLDGMDRAAGGGEPIGSNWEPPAPPPDLASALVGLTLTDAVATVVSLDLASAAEPAGQAVPS